MNKSEGYLKSIKRVNQKTQWEIKDIIYMNHKTLEDVEGLTNPLINLIQRESNGNEMQLRAVLITVIQRLADIKTLKL